ncbi:MAG: OB-fold nucleic acid binding domain-containing protein, partial [Porcipelethomonas sp.]
GIGRTALEYLIKAGAFDGMGANRRQMISKYLQFLGHAAENSRLNVEGQFDLFSGEGGTGISPYEDYKPLDEFRYSDILCFEKFATGMYISGHPVDPYKTVLRLMRVPEVCSLSEGIKEGKLKNGTPFCMCGVVDDISVRYTFAGRKMGFITIQDPTGFAECTVFPDVFIPNEKKLDYGNLLFIRGRVSSRPRYKDTFVAEEICDEKALEEIIAKKKLCVKAESSGNGKISAVSSIVKKYPGKTPFCFYFTDIKKLLRPRGIAGVSISPGLYRELCDAAGEQALGLID